MTSVVRPFQLLVIALAGWLNRQQQAVIDYLMEENRVLKEQLEGQRFRMILFGEASLRPAIREYVVHFRNERNHQGVGNLDCWSHVPRAIQSMGRFSAANGSGACSISTIGKQLESKDSVFAPYGLEKKRASAQDGCT